MAARRLAGENLRRRRVHFALSKNRWRLHLDVISLSAILSSVRTGAVPATVLLHILSGACEHLRQQEPVVQQKMSRVFIIICSAILLIAMSPKTGPAGFSTSPRAVTNASATAFKTCSLPDTSDTIALVALPALALPAVIRRVPPPNNAPFSTTRHDSPRRNRPPPVT